MAASAASLSLSCNVSPSSSAFSYSRRKNRPAPITCSCCSRVVVKVEGQPLILEGPAKKIKLEFPVEPKKELSLSVAEQSVPAANVKIEGAGTNSNRLSEEKERINNAHTETLNVNKQAESKLYVNDPQNKNERMVPNENKRMVPNKNNKIVPYHKPPHWKHNRGRRWQNRNAIAHHNNNRFFRTNKFSYNRNSNFGGMRNYSSFGYNQANFSNFGHYAQNQQGYFNNNFRCWSNQASQNFQKRAHFNQRDAMNNVFRNFGRWKNSNYFNQNQSSNRPKLMNSQTKGNFNNLVEKKPNSVDHKPSVTSGSSLMSSSDLGHENSVSAPSNTTKLNSSLCEKSAEQSSSNSLDDRDKTPSSLTNPSHVEYHSTSTNVSSEGENEDDNKEEPDDNGEDITPLKVLCHSCLKPSRCVNTSELSDIKIIYNSCDIQICSEEEQIESAVGSESGVEVVDLDTEVSMSHLKTRRSETETESCVFQESKNEEHISSEVVDCTQTKERRNLNQFEEKLENSSKSSGDELRHPQTQECISGKTSLQFDSAQCTENDQCDGNSVDVGNGIGAIDCDQHIEADEINSSFGETAGTSNIASKHHEEHNIMYTLSERELEDCEEFFEDSCHDDQDQGPSGFSITHNATTFSSSIVDITEDEVVALDQLPDSKEDDNDDLLIVSCTSAAEKSRQSRRRCRLGSLDPMEFENVQTRSHVSDSTVQGIISDVCDSDHSTKPKQESTICSTNMQEVEIIEPVEDVNAVLDTPDGCIATVEQHVKKSNQGISDCNLRIKSIENSSLKEDAHGHVNVESKSEKSSSSCKQSCNLDDDCLIVEVKYKEKSTSISPSLHVKKDDKKTSMKVDTSIISEAERKLYDEFPTSEISSAKCEVSEEVDSNVKLEEKPDCSLIQSASIINVSRDLVRCFVNHFNNQKKAKSVKENIAVQKKSLQEVSDPTLLVEDVVYLD